jgi:hypothetical protein
VDPVKWSTLGRVIRAKVVPVRRPTADFVVEYEGPVCASYTFQEIFAFGKVVGLNSLNISISVLCTTGFGFMMNKLEATAPKGVLV